MNYHTIKDESQKTRLVNHNQYPLGLQDISADVVIKAYQDILLKEYELDKAQIRNLSKQIPSKLILSEKNAFYFEAEKKIKGGKVFQFRQTYAGIPVWSAGLTMTIRENPNRLLSSTNTIYYNIEVNTVSEVQINKFSKLKGKELLKLLGVESESKIKINKISTYVFKFEKDKRFGHQHSEDNDTKVFKHIHPELPLPKLSNRIVDGKFYFAVEVLFTLSWKQLTNLNWRAFIDIENGEVLYCEAAVDNATGLVFKVDPCTQTGNLANNPDLPNATQNTFRSNVTLLGLNASSGGLQHLNGEFVTVVDIEPFTVAPPTAADPPADFSYNARTNNFAAVNAYYHNDAFFRFVQNLGFTVSDYFDGTTFPLQVDHRGRFGTIDGIEINASCSGTVGIDGIAIVDYELATLGDNTLNPMGLACDWRVALHELGGHGILWDHVSHPNFGFAHSAGDSFASI